MSTTIDEVSRKLKKLADLRTAKRIARKAARKGMNIVRDAARLNAKSIDDPETNEKIWKNISTQSGKTRDSGSIKMRVGVRGGASFSNPVAPSLSGGDTRHWRWIELGKEGVPAKPFMRIALFNNIDSVTNEFCKVFNDEIDKELI